MQRLRRGDLRPSRGLIGHEWALVALVISSDNKKCRFAAAFEADDGTRTHDLLHGKSWRAFAPVRSSSPKPAVCSSVGRASERHRTRANGECSHCSHCDRCHAQLARPGSQPHAPCRSDARVLCGDSQSVASPGTIWYSRARETKRVTAERYSPNPHFGTPHGQKRAMLRILGAANLLNAQPLWPRYQSSPSSAPTPSRSLRLLKLSQGWLGRSSATPSTSCGP